MARKRTKASPQADVSPSETINQPITHENEADPVEPEPDIFDQQIALRQQQAAGIVQQVAEGMKMPEESPPQSAAEKAQSFAEKVGKREPGYTNQGTRDSIAGARIHEYQDKEQGIYLSIIKFDEKPSREVTSKLREAHFDFSYENQEWTRPIRYETRQQDRINADEVFVEVCKLVRESKGVSHSFGGQSVA